MSMIIDPTFPFDQIRFFCKRIKKGGAVLTQQDIFSI